MSEYADKLRAKGIGVLTGGVTKDKVVEGRDEQGAKIKSVTDELGNTVTEHNNKKDQVDVTVRPQFIQQGGA